jgi:hypothetical protein
MLSLVMTPEQERSNAEARKVAIAKLIVESPLYKTIHFDDVFHTDLMFLLNEVSFNYFCEIEKIERTFQLQPVGMAKSLTERIKPFLEGHKLNEIELYSGTCSGCKQYKTYFTFQLFSKDVKKKEGHVQPPVFLKKIGQNPPFSITPERDILEHLKEDADHYKKALICISQSYGIAAYAYFRRILENEIKRIASEIILLKVPGYEDVNQVLTAYFSNHQMSPLIDSIADHLPMSMIIDGQNPIKILYKSYSEAIHTLSEDECLSKAMQSNKILVFVIKQLKKEGTEYNEVKRALHDLNK